jgi:hypothetical protein
MAVSVVAKESVSPRIVGAVPIQAPLDMSITIIAVVAVIPVVAAISIIICAIAIAQTETYCAISPPRIAIISIIPVVPVPIVVTGVGSMPPVTISITITRATPVIISFPVASSTPIAMSIPIAAPAVIVIHSPATPSDQLNVRGGLHLSRQRHRTDRQRLGWAGDHRSYEQRCYSSSCRY